MDKEFLLLKLRNAIADKEWTIACANMETRIGGWRCDWYREIRIVDKDVIKYIELIEAIN